MDGSSLGNPGPSGVGGVIRNDKGEFVCGFANFTAHKTNNAAEVLGLLYGLRYVCQLDIQQVEIEMDSMLVIDWLQVKKCRLWYLEDYWEEVLYLLDRLRFSMNHAYREINSAADGLARMGAKGGNSLWFSFSKLPMVIKGIIRLEKIGYPYMRNV